MVKERIKSALDEIFVELFANTLPFSVERSNSFAHGDYSTNAAMFLMRQMANQTGTHVGDVTWARLKSAQPIDAANYLAERLTEKLTDIEIKVEKPGFINFFLSREALIPKEQKIPQLYAGKKIMVEYTDPNPFKEFHIGHLMSNAIGESIARLLGAAGAEVVRANYQGDVGLHVAKALWGKKTAPAPENWTWGASYARGAQAYENDPQAKIEIEEINRKVYESSDSEIENLYKEGVKWSLDHFEEIYKKLNMAPRVHFGQLRFFDFYFFESQSWRVGKVIVQENTPPVFEVSDGAVVYKGEKDGLHTRVFINSQGLPTYEAKDLGLLKIKKEKGDFDQSLTITASEQKEYFKVVLAAARNIPELREIATKTKHITHGMMRLVDGKMSSRTGNVITGESLIYTLTDQAKIKMNERELKNADMLSEQIAVGAIKYAVLKSGSNKDIIFDPEKSLSLEGDSGPYLQYALVRARAVLKKAEPASVMPSLDEKGYWMNLARVLVHYPDVVARAATEFEPHYLTTYLTELAATFNSWYGADQFIVDGKILGVYLALIKSFESTMEEGLGLLGIPTPEEM